MKTNGSPCHIPPMLVFEHPPSLAAGTRPGTTWASAPNTVSIARKPVIPRALAAAGRCGLKIEPGGTMTRMGRMYPSAFGMSARTMQRSATKVAE